MQNSIEVKAEIHCAYCRSKLSFDLVATVGVNPVLHQLKIQVEPCSRCTQDAMEQAWNDLRKKAQILTEASLIGE